MNTQTLKTLKKIMKDFIVVGLFINFFLQIPVTNKTVLGKKIEKKKQLFNLIRP